eukprot:COSAG05_NODE_2677_length_2775_cov_27.104634_2_plen_124_part_00
MLVPEHWVKELDAETKEPTGKWVDPLVYEKEPIAGTEDPKFAEGKEVPAAPDLEEMVNFDINSRNRHNGFTSLHWTCENGHVECMEVLLEAGANWTLLDYMGRTGREIAAQKMMRGNSAYYSC